MRGNNKVVKTCPFLDRPCLGEGCGIYYQQFTKCSIEIMPYNIFKLVEAMKLSDPDNK